MTAEETLESNPRPGTARDNPAPDIAYDNTEIKFELAPGYGDLHEAAFKGDVFKAVRLLSNDRDKIWTRDDLGRTPLHYASMMDHPGLLNVLIENGANVNAADEDGNTPLHFAVVTPPKDIRAEHMDIKQELAPGHGDLHKAAFNGNASEAIRLLSINKDRVHTRDDLGRTPLHYACMMANPAVLRVLMENGADVNAMDDNGMTGRQFVGLFYTGRDFN